MSTSIRDWTSFIKQVGRGARGARDLPESDAEELFGAMLDGEVPEMELGALWIAYRIKGESLGELRGFCTAVAKRIARIDVPDGPMPVILPSYNGARRLPNMTPLLAMLLAREGIPVLMHGVADSYGRVTTISILRELGIAESKSAVSAAGSLKRGRLAYMPLEALSPGLARLMTGRMRIGVRSSAHTIAKLLDPFGGKALRIVPVTHPDYLQRMTDLFAVDGWPAILLRGSEGEPYASPRRMPALTLFKQGEGREIEPQGDHEVTADSLSQEVSAATTAAWIGEVLSGAKPVPPTLMTQVQRFSAAARGQS